MRTCHSHHNESIPINAGQILIQSLEAQVVRYWGSFGGAQPTESGSRCLSEVRQRKYAPHNNLNFQMESERNRCIYQHALTRLLLPYHPIKYIFVVPPPPSLKWLVRSCLKVLGFLPSSHRVSSSSGVNNYTFSWTASFMLESCKVFHSPVPVSAPPPATMQGNSHQWRTEWMENLALSVKRSLHL